MRVIPVIDLKAGQVVRGVAGRRAMYRPIVSGLAADASPETVARALVEKYSFDEVYVADLDGLAGGEPDWDAFQRIAGCGMRLWIDAGAGQAARVCRWAESPEAVQLEGAIVALESVADRATLQAIFADVDDPRRAVFSLDLQDGRPLSRSPHWQRLPPERIATMAAEIGFGRLIVLDLHWVGKDQGPGAAPLCRALRRSHPELELISGGGVRGPRDLKHLADAGCDAALVASALHDGKLTPNDLGGYRV